MLYSFTIDVSSPNGVLKMIFTVLISWLVGFYGRIIKFSILSLSVIHMLRLRHATILFSSSMIAFFFMSLFNLIFLLDASRKLFKFSKLYAKQVQKEVPCGTSSAILVLVLLKGFENLKSFFFTASIKK